MTKNAVFHITEEKDSSGVQFTHMRDLFIYCHYFMISGVCYILLYKTNFMYT